jgi:hypothetical protein
MLCCRMDRELLEDALLAAELHLAEVEWQVANQSEHVARLQREGRDTAGATKLLTELEEVLSVHLADRDRLRKELGL